MSKADYPARVMNHFYQQDQCSGAFVYSIDDCKPLCIKFHAKIRINVVLDKVTISTATTGNNNIQNRQDGQIQALCDNQHQSVLNSQDQQCLRVREKQTEATFSDISNNTNNFITPSVSLPNTAGVNREHVNHPSVFEAEKESELLHFTSEHFSSGDIPYGDGITKQKQENHSLRLMQEKSNAVLIGRTGEISKSEGSEHARTVNYDTDSKQSHEQHLHKETTDNGDENRTDYEFENGETSLEKNTAARRRRGKKRKKETKSKQGKTVSVKDVKCCYCNVTFETKLDFFNHRRTKGGSFKCDVCGVVKPFQALLMVHKLIHDPESSFSEEGEENDKRKGRRNKIKCKVCGLVVSSLDSLKVHMITHTDEHPYQCCVCEDQKFFSLSSLCHHQQTHIDSQRFQCKECSMRFSSRGDMSRHKLTHKLKCSFCGEVFPNKTSRACHYRMAHSQEMKKCLKCYNLFSTDEELAKHMLYHENRKLEKCPECNMFVTKLKDHMTVHSGKSAKRFVCSQCPQSYCRKSSLDRHLLVHTGERPYACYMCPKTFRDHGMLRKHLFTHTQERPFVCEMCGRQFAAKYNLVTHMKVHAEKKIHSCLLCRQSFSHKTSLDAHTRHKHNAGGNSGSFNCMNCFKPFQKEEDLLSHFINQHKDADEWHEINQGLSLTSDQTPESTYDNNLLTSSLPAQSSYPPQIQNDTDWHNSMQLLDSSVQPVLETETERFASFEPSSSYLLQPSNTQLIGSLPSPNVDSLMEKAEMASYISERASPLTQGSAANIFFLPSGLEHLPYPSSIINSTASTSHSHSNIDHQIQNETKL